MYPGFISRWKSERCDERRVGEGWSYPGHRGWHRGWEYAAGEEEPGHLGFGGGGAFGVRRPLRFLAYKLQLEEAQVAELARILDEIKTERAQAAVDHRRALSAFADAISGDVFDAAKASAGAKLRLESADRLRDAVMKALEQLHRLLDPQQRTRLAYLIRTGTLTI
ncbi:MAG TPA: Spy/CpxP family protein refolding chaperone [Thermoanaerobaculia bacterium]|jgi:Spy/CpxP family protein refolding chaperone